MENEFLFLKLHLISKNLKRAPNWVIKLNLEWLYRAIKQPKRIFRQLELIKFVFLVLLDRNKGGNKNAPN